MTSACHSHSQSVALFVNATLGSEVVQSLPVWIFPQPIEHWLWHQSKRGLGMGRQRWPDWLSMCACQILPQIIAAPIVIIDQCLSVPYVSGQIDKGNQLDIACPSSHVCHWRGEYEIWSIVALSQLPLNNHLTSYPILSCAGRLIWYILDSWWYLVLKLYEHNCLALFAKVFYGVI